MRKLKENFTGRGVVELTTTVCVVGGGPAGMMAGLLLARSGVEVIVLEKHKDFFRDFRGDTVHPSTMDVLYELGLLPKFLKLPHQKVKNYKLQFGDKVVKISDFSHLPTHCRFMAFVPQWDFLDLLATEAKKYSTFRLLMEADASGLIREHHHVAGVKGHVVGRKLKVHSKLVIAADGRHSLLRSSAQLAVSEIGTSIDVLWMRIPRITSDPESPLVRFKPGSALVTVNRGTYYQCGVAIPKDSLQKIKRRGLPLFRQRIAEIAPLFRNRVKALKSWDDVKLLNVSLNRMRQWWRPGLLCIGDVAHAMGPQGGIGINLAIQDAVAASNILAEPLKTNTLTSEHLRAIQKRREFPMRFYQGLQRILQEKIIDRSLAATDKPRVPWFFQLLQVFPALQCIPARIVGIGVRPEHITL